MSEGLLFNVKWVVFSYIMPWDDYDDVRFVLDQHAVLDFYSANRHWNNSPRVDMSLHSDTLFWFRANQSLLLPRAVYYYGISVIV